MDSTFHTIQFRLAAVPGAGDKVLLDGTPLKRCTDIEVYADCHGATKVRLTFIANVIGEINDMVVNGEVGPASPATAEFVRPRHLERDPFKKLDQIKKPAETA